jgi:hypothetical protein
VAGLVVLAIIAALLHGPGLIMRIAPLRSWVLNSPPVRRGLGENARLSAEQVSRLSLGGVALRGLALEVRDPSGAWHPAVRIGHLVSDWSVMGLLRGRFRISRLEAVPLLIDLHYLSLLTASADGPDTTVAIGRAPPLVAPVGWAAPAWLPPVAIERFRLGRFEVSDSAGVMFTGDLTLEQMRASQSELRLTVREGWLLLDRLNLACALSKGLCRWWHDGADLRGLALDSPRLKGRVDARFSADLTPPGLQVDIDLDRLDPNLVAEHYLPSLEFSGGDTLTGSIGLIRSEGPWRLDLVLAGRALGEPLHELSARLMAGGGRLRLDDLVLSGGAGDLRGTLYWDSAPRELTAQLAWELRNHRSAWLPYVAQLPLTDPSFGSAEATLSLPSEGRPVVAGRVDVRGVRLWDIPTRRVRFSGRVELARAVRASSFEILFPTGEMRGHGVWPLGPGEVDGAVTLDSIPLELMPDAWRMGIGGRASGQIRIGGVPDDPVLEGRLHAVDLSRGDWTAQRAAASALLLWPRDQRGSGRLDLQGLRHAGGPPGRVSTRFSRWNRWLSFVTDADLRDHRLHLEGRVDPEGYLELERASAAVRRLGRWSLARPFYLSWATDTLSADTLHLASGPAHIRAAGHWVRGSDEVTASLAVADLPLTMLQELSGPERVLRGRCNLELDAHGELPDPQVALHLAGDSVAIGDLEIGELELAAQWADSQLTVGPMTARGRQQIVGLQSLSVGLRRPLLTPRGSGGELPAHCPDWDSALTQAPWSGEVEVARLDLSRWGPVIGLPAPVEGDTTRAIIHISRWVAGREVPIRVEAPWELTAPAVGAGSLRGTWRGSLTLAGTPGAPELRLSGTTDDLSLARIPLGSLRLDLSYADSLLTLRQLQLIHQERMSHASGTYPFICRAYPLQAGPLDAPADLAAQLEDLNLALLSNFAWWLPDAHGRINGDLALLGTSVDPELSGALRIADGGFRIPGRSERIYGVRGDLLLGPRGIEIRSLTGRSGREGRLSAWGRYAGGGDFDLHATADHVRIFKEGNYEFDANAEAIHAYTAIPPGEEEPAPHLSGSVEVLSGTYVPDLRGGRGSPEREGRTPWRIDLNVSVPGNVRVSQSSAVSQTDANVDVGDGLLHVTHHWPHWNASGSLNIQGGTYRLFNNNFTITGGSLDFRDTGTGPDVTVAIDGETSVMTVTSDELDPRSELVTIRVQVQGPPDELQATLSSDPEYGTEEILELLVSGRLLSATDTDMQQAVLTTGAQEILFTGMASQIEERLLEQFPVVSRVVVAPGTTVDEPWRLSVERSIFSHEIMGRYSQEFYRGRDWELSLDYRLSRILYLRAGVVHDPDRVGEENEYQMDLKCRFEF